MEIIKIGNKILEKKSKRVASIDDTIRNLCSSMVEAMYANNGIGLAAPQVGILKRIIVVDDCGTPLILINPEVIATSDECVCMNEGCLSIPEQFISISRPESITVKYRSTKGKPYHQIFSGLLARIIQHEIDHLDGKLMVDYEN